MNKLMELNGFKAQIMEADRLVGNDVFGLPPGKALPVYKVSDFIKKSSTWMDEDGCYVVPVKPDKGLWFNWSGNDDRNTCVLPSVKGCNPITGQKIDGFTLESYQKKCPVHGTDLKNLYCEECGYKWAPQNYISAPNILWWDGFRDEDGKVRQFFFTEDMKRDVAAAMLGKENTVPAFGFAFFAPKEPRMSVKYNKDGTFTRLDKPRSASFTATNTSTLDKWTKSKTSTAKGSKDVYSSCCTSSSFDIHPSFQSMKTNLMDQAEYSAPRGLKLSKCSDDSIQCMSGINGVSGSVGEAGDAGVFMAFADMSAVDESPKEVAVGAGAQIEQAIDLDIYGVETWKDDPDAVMRIYFVFEDEFNEYAKHGFKGEHGSMLKGVALG